MKPEHPLWSKPAGTPEVRSAEIHGHDAVKGVPQDRTNSPAVPNPVVGQPVKRQSTDRKWPWPRTLRFALLVSGLFWLVVGLSVWAYLSAG